MVSNVKTLAKDHGKRLPQILKVVCSPQEKSTHSRIFPLAIHDSGGFDRPSAD